MFVNWTYETGYVFKYDATVVAAASTETDNRVTLRRDDGALFYLRRSECGGQAIVGTKGTLTEKSKGREFLLGRRLSDITFEAN